MAPTPNKKKQSASSHYPHRGAGGAVSSGIIIALGGNALIRPGEVGDVDQQFAHARETFRPIMQLIEDYGRVLIVHGNGPQVGNDLLRNELSVGQLAAMPLDSCVANSQGRMGYMIQQVIQNRLSAREQLTDTVTVVTQTLVDDHDPAFQNPTKPVGSFYSKEEAEELKRNKKWCMIEDSGRGYRRVVASPKPQAIIELPAITKLYRGGSVVIAGGGGGVPVVRRNGLLHGVAAVVDKDLVTELFALHLRPSLLVMLTAVEKVYVGFGTKNQWALETVTTSELRTHIANDEFGVGSMLPKISCALCFVETTGGKALITSPESLAAALNQQTGTWIVR